MARSLGLTAYRAWARRAEPPADDGSWPARPAGQLIWIHAGETSNLLAVQDLAKRLVASQNRLNVLMTTSANGKPDATAALPVRDTILAQAAPSEHPVAVARFLDHWQPDVCIWVWGGLRPNLILAASDRGIPLLLIDADADGFDRSHGRWLPDLTRHVLSRFSTVIARSAAGQRRLTQMGVLPSKVQHLSPLLAGGQALPCIDSDLTDLSSAMGGRPTWFAAHLLPNEMPIVLTAHKQALRLSHRLLLLVQPASPGAADGLAALATDQHLACVRWDEGQYPDETTQVMISGDPRDRGLFFRLAPVSFMGSTLIQGNDGCDPLDAAALGSAVLYGPKVRHFLPSYSRLATAGAARIVNDADALGIAVTSLIAPDHAATMAHAGWDVISQGAELADRVVDLVQDALDRDRSPA